MHATVGSKNQKKEEKNVTKQPEVTEVETLQMQIAQLEEKLTQAQVKEQRALADYQNLVRRTQEEMVRRSKLAAHDFVVSLLQPVEHLHMAAQQLKDPGLTMVVDQFWKVLAEQGLEKMDCLGKPFESNSMEAVESAGNGEIVTKVLRNGYMLHDEVVQVARVILD